jgi:hypothetical protein
MKPTKFKKWFSQADDLTPFLRQRAMDRLAPQTLDEPATILLKRELPMRDAVLAVTCLVQLGTVWLTDFSIISATIAAGLSTN